MTYEEFKKALCRNVQNMETAQNKTIRLLERQMICSDPMAVHIMSVMNRHMYGRENSGDIGHMDEQGFLYIDGRIKRIIIRHDGFKVFPTQIENVIATCPEVKTCCAIGRADKDHSQGKLPVVYITLSREKKDKMKLKEELNSLCKQMLPEYMQPIDFVFIDKMPLTANGKVDFHELEGIELSNRL